MIVDPPIHKRWEASSRARELRRLGAAPWPKRVSLLSRRAPPSAEPQAESAESVGKQGTRRLALEPRARAAVAARRQLRTEGPDAGFGPTGVGEGALRGQRIKTFRLKELLQMPMPGSIGEGLTALVETRDPPFSGVKVYEMQSKQDLQRAYRVLQHYIPDWRFVVYFAFDITPDKRSLVDHARGARGPGMARRSSSFLSLLEYDHFMQSSVVESRSMQAFHSKISDAIDTNYVNVRHPVLGHTIRENTLFGICPHNTFCTATRRSVHDFLGKVPGDAKILIELDIAGPFGHSDCAMTHFTQCGFSQDDVVQEIEALAQRTKQGEVIVIFDFKSDPRTSLAKLRKKDFAHPCISQYEQRLSAINARNIYKRTI